MSKCELKPCPFCGKENLIIITCADECCGNACESCDTISYAICCNINLNGCGASSGFCETKEKAIEKWNRRVEK